jgi:hypothetical protein
VHNEQPDHADSSPSSGLVVRPVIGVLGKDDGDDDVACGHANGSDGEDWATADSIDPENGGNGGDEHDDADYTGGEKLSGVAALAKLFEDGGRVVQNSIDALQIC